ncbi:MAG: hypothetical protein AB7D01_07865, partial [Methanoculleus sp.]
MQIRGYFARMCISSAFLRGILSVSVMLFHPSHLHVQVGNRVLSVINYIVAGLSAEPVGGIGGREKEKRGRGSLVQ